MSEYGLQVSFPEQGEMYVLGFEAGMLWVRLENGDLRETTMHTANQECFTRIARSYGLNVEFAPAEEGWSVARFSRGRPKLRAVPAGRMCNTHGNWNCSECCPPPDTRS